MELPQNMDPITGQERWYQGLDSRSKRHLLDRPRQRGGDVYAQSVSRRGQSRSTSRPDLALVAGQW